MSTEGLMKDNEAAWGSAETQQRGNLPPGRYQFAISPPDDLKVVKKDSDDRTRARVVLTVVSGPNEGVVGRRTSKSWGLFDEFETPDEKGISILKTELASLGVDVHKLSFAEVPQAILSLEGAIVNANVRIKMDQGGVERQNIYFNGLASSPAKDELSDGSTY